MDSPSSSGVPYRVTVTRTNTVGEPATTAEPQQGGGHVVNTTPDVAPLTPATPPSVSSTPYDAAGSSSATDRSGSAPGGGVGRGHSPDTDSPRPIAPVSDRSRARDDDRDDDTDDNDDDDTGSELSDLSCESPQLLTLSEMATMQTNPVDVLRTRIHALGTAILEITETALTATGASLEDSLKLEHKAGARKKKRRKKAPGAGDRISTRLAGGRALSGRPKTPKGGSVAEAKGRSTMRPSVTPSRQPSVVKSGAAGGRLSTVCRKSRPGTTAAATAGRPSATSATPTQMPLQVKKCPPKGLKKTPGKEQGSAVLSSDLEAAASPTTSAATPPPPLPSYGFYIPPPVEVLRRLDASPSLSTYQQRLEGLRSASSAALPADRHDTSPLYDASAAACHCAASKVGSGAAATWSAMRDRSCVRHSSEATENGSRCSDSGAYIARASTMPTLTGEGSSDCGTSAGPTLLSSRPLSPEELASVSKMLFQQRQAAAADVEGESVSMGASSVAAGATAADEHHEEGHDHDHHHAEEERSFRVVYVHRYNDAHWDDDMCDVFSAPSRSVRGDGAASTEQSMLSAGRVVECDRSSVLDLGMGSTYHRAIYSLAPGPSSPATAALTPGTGSVVQVELHVGAINEKVRDYVSRSLCTAPSHADPASRTASPNGPGRAEVEAQNPLAPPHDRSASEDMGTPAIDRRIRRLESWQNARRRGVDAGRQQRRRHSLFSRPAQLRVSPGAAGAEFYYYAPATDAPAPAVAGADHDGDDDTYDMETPRQLQDNSVKLAATTTPPVPSGAVVDVLLASPNQREPIGTPVPASAQTRSPSCSVRNRATPEVLSTPQTVSDAPFAAATPTVTAVAASAPDAAHGDGVHHGRIVGPAQFLEVVVANGYNTMEWVSCGAARRHQMRRPSDSIARSLSPQRWGEGSGGLVTPPPLPTHDINHAVSVQRRSTASQMTLTHSFVSDLSGTTSRRRTRGAAIRLNIGGAGG